MVIDGHRKMDDGRKLPQGLLTITSNHNQPLKTSKTVDNFNHILSQKVSTYYLR